MPKRKTLPKDFDKLIQDGNTDEIKAAMLGCLPNAIGGYYKHNALAYEGVNEETARWLIEYGADINMPDRFGNTPLWHQAGYANNAENNADTIRLYIELGADAAILPEFDGGVPHHAADRGSVCNLRALINCGVDINLNDRAGNTPLEYMLSRCYGADIPSHMAMIELLVDSGAAVTDKARRSVETIGKDVEFRRSGYGADTAREIDAAMERLYALFSVAPAEKRRVHDGVSPIIVKQGKWTEQYEELWNYLVPGSGPCKTAQGEAIRINGRISYEILDNGRINWNKEYEKATDSLIIYLGRGMPLRPKELDAAKKLADIIKHGGECEAELNELCKLSVKWVAQNSAPIAPGSIEYGI